MLFKEFPSFIFYRPRFQGDEKQAEILLILKIYFLQFLRKW